MDGRSGDGVQDMSYRSDGSKIGNCSNNKDLTLKRSEIVDLIVNELNCSMTSNLNKFFPNDDFLKWEIRGRVLNSMFTTYHHLCVEAALKSLKDDAKENKHAKK